MSFDNYKMPGKINNIPRKLLNRQNIMHNRHENDTIGWKRHNMLDDMTQIEKS